MKSKMVSLLLIAICLINSYCLADDFIVSFLIGNYAIIGQKPDSDITYSGTLSLELNKDKIIIVRNIDSTIVKATATIDSVTADQIPVLRIRFNENNKDYEGTFLISSDLDNYGRLTGYIYLKDNSTQRAGLEAWFADFGQLSKKSY